MKRHIEELPDGTTLYTQLSEFRNPAMMETAKKIVAGEEVPATIELEEGIFPADIAEQELPNRTY